MPERSGAMGEVETDLVEAIRDRLRKVLARAVVESREVECPTCRGAGHIGQGRRTVTQTDVAEAIGTSRTSVTNFLAGRQTFTMPVALRLLDWLAAQETPR